MPKRALVLIDIRNDSFPGGRWALCGTESAAGSSYWTCSDAACTVTVVELVVTPPNPVAVST